MIGGWSSEPRGRLVAGDPIASDDDYYFSEQPVLLIAT